MTLEAVQEERGERDAQLPAWELPPSISSHTEGACVFVCVCVCVCVCVTLFPPPPAGDYVFNEAEEEGEMTSGSQASSVSLDRLYVPSMSTTLQGLV